MGGTFHWEKRNQNERSLVLSHACQLNQQKQCNVVSKNATSVFPSNKYGFLPVCLLLNNHETLLQLKYIAELPTTFWVNHCPFDNYNSVDWSQYTQYVHQTLICGPLPYPPPPPPHTHTRAHTHVHTHTEKNSKWNDIKFKNRSYSVTVHEDHTVKKWLLKECVQSCMCTLA